MGVLTPEIIRKCIVSDNMIIPHIVRKEKCFLNEYLTKYL